MVFESICSISRSTYLELHSFMVVKPHQVVLLSFGIGFEKPTFQVFLPRSEGTKITWCEVLDVGSVFHQSLWWGFLTAMNFARLARLLCLYRFPFTET
ncbi:hypothetical protein AVEN_82117-1 [Araneus ventricosus]|uniref:Uncharacterized protein n=1 Tax=Araneus ventricosus TaxID=182803 RepID=A0A4Y2I4R8_ARAVE|nr:hypothetical protein AVEN_82117-1 [Araneus ventricosus]